MAFRYVNLHSGNVWEQTKETGTEQEYTRLNDGVTIEGPQPQYFRKITNALEEPPVFDD